MKTTYRNFVFSVFSTVNFGSVGKHSQNRKKSRITLEFVDTDQLIQCSEDIARILQSRLSNHGNYLDLEDPVVAGLPENPRKPMLRNYLFDSISY